MSERARAYRFRTAAQWHRCIASSFDAPKDGALQPLARLGLNARPLTTTGAVSLVAADALGGPFWRLHRDDDVLLLRRNDFGEVSRPFEVAETLATTSRWVLNGDWLWAFRSAPPIVRRYERDTLAEDRALDLTELPLPPIAVTFPRQLEIRDLAGDGRNGAWLLIAASGDEAWLLHLDCELRPQELHRVPPDARQPVQLGMVGRGARLVLLTKDGRLFFIDARTGAVLRALERWNTGACRRARRLTTDGASRIALLGYERDDTARWAVFVFDGEGDSLDVISGPQKRFTERPNDIAMAEGVLWLAADDGLWHIDSSEASIARESESVLITPALYSPQSGEGGGWLRAEISVDLPRGAVIEAQAVTTNDDRIAREATEIANDLSRTAAQRQQAVWDLFDHERARVFHLTAPPAQGQPVAVPLFESTDRWLWLRLKLTTPPGVAPPAISELRVLYPDASLVQYLPGAFRGAENDPTGFLRSLVGVLETTTQAIDDKIRSVPSQIDPDRASSAWLDYVARWLDLPWEDALPVEAKRRIVRNAAALLEHRGTRRGLELLLASLLGSTGRARMVDVTADHPLRRLGGRDCQTGARLPLLLAGAPAAAPILGTRAVLGRVCLGTPCDPLHELIPTLRIVVTASRSTQGDLAPVIERLLAQYVPAGIKVVVTWRVTSALLAGVGEGEGDVLDANGPGRLGEDSELGRVTLRRRGALRVNGGGLDMGFGLS